MGGFFPGKKYGGPPVSIDNFCSLMNEHDCYIVTHNHDLFEKEAYKDISDGWNDRGNCRVLYLPDEKYNKVSFKRIIVDIKPDILYLQGLFQPCVFPCLNLAKKYNMPVLLAPRGELCDGALSIRKWKKLPYIKAVKVLGLVKNIHWQSTSEEETNAIKKHIRAEENHIHRLNNIPSIPKTEYKRREKKPGEGRFVFLSRIHTKKNLLFAITLFEKIEGKVEFDIYGPVEEEEYWTQCMEEIKKLPDNILVRYMGLVGHEHVHEIFSQYDAFLFPTLSENYGHVIAESLFVGTPVIISDQTPWNDVEKYCAGKAIPLTDEKNFVLAIQEIVNNDFGDERVSKVKTYANMKCEINKLRVEYNSAIVGISKQKQ